MTGERRDPAPGVGDPAPEHSPTSVIATYEYDPAEHYHTLRTLTKLTKLRWVVPLFCFIVPAVGIALLTFAARVTGQSVARVLAPFLPFALLLFICGVQIPFAQRRRARKLPSLNPSMRGPQERRLDAEGYHSRGNGVTMDVPWHVMTKAMETETVFLFFYNWKTACYLPKRPLDSVQIGQVRALARSALGERAELLAP